ncbi:hypothetical protein [Leuconostoc gasicomitatum]|uniref:hypothetical protein n=1 Tax=Leuconostoc gasicomitatum TaxID=115778 RepID=UPI001CC5E33E|nr:hypothetical protein [Leuconostoc gasicomitatum]MBZ5958125.1 hypothetical protein [Leuconostoc gasicomitatum]
MSYFIERFGEEKYNEAKAYVAKHFNARNYRGNGVDKSFYSDGHQSGAPLDAHERLCFRNDMMYMYLVSKG